MTYKLLTPEDIVAITGMKRYSTQTKWFEENFRVRVVCRPDGSILMTQEVFEALLAKRLGIAPRVATPLEIDRPALRPASIRSRPVKGGVKK
jgi:hypothetical protein